MKVIKGNDSCTCYRDGSEEEREYMIKKQEMQLNEFRRIL
jgi:hypothetical protein